MTATKSIRFDDWESITDVPCIYRCDGTIRWAEAGYVPGYRICDRCGRHFELRGGNLAANGRRDRVTAKDSEARAEARAEAEKLEKQERSVWQLIHAVQRALPCEQGGEIYGPEYDNGVSGDDLSGLAAKEAEVQEMTGTVNIGSAKSHAGIAARIATMRQIAYPAAWATYTKIRATLPTSIKVIVSQDAARVRLCGKWTLGEYAVVELCAALPEIAASARDLLNNPMNANQRVAEIVVAVKRRWRNGKKD